MKMRNGLPSRNPFLQMQGTIRADQSMIRHSRHTTQRIKRTHPSTAYPFLMKTVIRKQENARARVQNTYGSGYQYPLMTGMNIPKLRNGESHGRNTAINILRLVNR